MTQTDLPARRLGLNPHKHAVLALATIRGITAGETAEHTRWYRAEPHTWACLIAAALIAQLRMYQPSCCQTVSAGSCMVCGLLSFVREDRSRIRQIGTYKGAPALGTPIHYPDGSRPCPGRRLRSTPKSRCWRRRRRQTKGTRHRGWGSSLRHSPRLCRIQSVSRLRCNQWQVSRSPRATHRYS